MTASVPATTAVKLAQRPGATIKSWLSGMAKVDAQQGGEVERVLPKLPEVTSDVVAAMERLPEIVRTLALPNRARELTEAEEKDISAALHDWSIVSKFLKDVRDDALRPALFNHLDRQAETDGTVGPDTPVDKNGFYLVCGSGPGYAREYRQGTPSADVDKLAEMVDAGEITHKEFLSMTKQVRVVDDEGFLKFVARNSDRVGLLRRAVKYTRAASVALSVK